MAQAIAQTLPAGPDQPTVREAAARLALALASPGAVPDMDGHLAALYRAVLALFWNHADPAAHRHELCLPLTEVVSRHRSRKGQQACAELADAIARADAAGALDACRELALIERAEALARRNR